MKMPPWAIPLLLAASVAVWMAAAFSQRGVLVPVILCAPLAVLTVLHHPAWGLWLLVLFLPFAPAFAGAFFFVGSTLLPALVLGAWLLHLLRLRRSPGTLPGGLTLWFALFIAWVVFASMFSRHPTPGIVLALRYALLFVVLVAVADRWGMRSLRRVLLAYGLIVVPIAAYAIWQMATLGPKEVLFFQAIGPKRLASIYDNPNALGVTMGHGIVILFAFLLTRLRPPLNLGRSLVIGALAAAVLLIGGGLVTSFSRSAYVYAAIALLVLTLCYRRLRLLALGGVAAIGIALVLLPVPLWLYSVLRIGSGSSYRVSLWGAGWRMLQDHPWVGVGAGSRVFENYRSAHIESAADRALATTVGGGAHNVFMTKGAELGWPGLILVVGLFILIWSRVPRALRAYQRGDWVRGAAAAAVVGLTFRGMFESGTILGMGDVPDSLNFFLFALILVAPEPADPGHIVLAPAEQLRSGRTGGQRLWAALVDHWKGNGLEVISEDESPVPSAMRDRPLPLALRHLFVHGGMRRGVVIADQSDGGRLGLLLRRLRLRPRVRIVVVVHHLREEFRFTLPLYVRLMRGNETSLLRLADRIVVHTQTEASRVAARGVPADRITLIPVGIPNAGARVPIRELAPGEPLRLLWIGGDFDRKGLSVLLRAIASMPARRPLLTVVGRPYDDGTARRAESLTAELDLKEHVRFLGAVPQEAMESLWSSHDVFVIPSLHEGHGTSLDEALIRGMPALASDLPVFRERLTEAEVRFVPLRDESALAAALEELRDREIRGRFAEAGARRAAGFPSWEGTLAGYERVVREELALTAS